MSAKKHESVCFDLYNKLNVDLGGITLGLESEFLVIIPDQIVSAIKMIKDDYGYIQLIDICGVDCMYLGKKSGNEKRFCVVYNFLNLESHHRLMIKTYVDEGENISSITGIFKSADWYEREVWEMFGVEFDGGRKKRLLTHHEFDGLPLRKDFDIQNQVPLENVQQIDFPERVVPKNDNPRYWINLGPVHPVTNSSGRIMIEQMGEHVEYAEMEVGYRHRGFEKLCEQKEFLQILPFVDRLTASFPAVCNMLWCKTVEELLGITIPDRAQAVRMIFAEISRIFDHMTTIYEMAKTVGYEAGMNEVQGFLKRVNEVFSLFVGNSVLFTSYRIGGLSRDIPAEWIQQMLDVLGILTKQLAHTRKMFTGSRLWMERTQTFHLEASEAIDKGFSGPNLRASGINYDIRKNRPYYYYSDVDFEVPLGINGGAYDRYLVRIEEVRQSLKIISQLLDNLPTGTVMLDDSRFTMPDKEEVFTDSKELENHCRFFSDGIVPQEKEIYSFVESSAGELGFYIISDGGKRPYRVKLRSPGFPACQAWSQIAKGHKLEDVAIGFASFGVDFCELDR